MRNRNTVRLWPTPDSIPFNHWNRFYHQDTPPSPQARRVGDSPNMGPSPRLREVYLSPLSPIAHATVRILPGRNASRPFPPRFSAARMLSSSSSTLISPRRSVLSTAGGRSFVRAHLSTTTKRRITVSWWSGTRPTSCPAQKVVRSQKKLPWTSSTNSSRHRGPRPVAWRHRRTGET